MRIANSLKAFKIFPTLIALRRTKRWTPQEIVDFSLASTILQPLQIPSELQRFAEIVARLNPKLLLEIGTSHGGTLCVLSRLAAADGVIISVDLPAGEYGGGYKWYHIPIFRSFVSGKQRLHLLRGNSHSPTIETAVRDIVGKDRKFDLLFIDGDHSYSGVKSDFETYVDLVRPGGMVAFHDIAEHPPDLKCEVSQLWRELKGKYRHEEIIESHDQGWAGIGILYV
jgi:predicted O-methyltransferase YrrM